MTYKAERSIGVSFVSFLQIITFCNTRIHYCNQVMELMYPNSFPIQIPQFYLYLFVESVVHIWACVKFFQFSHMVPTPCFVTATKTLDNSNTMPIALPTSLYLSFEPKLSLGRGQAATTTLCIEQILLPLVRKGWIGLKISAVSFSEKHSFLWLWFLNASARLYHLYTYLCAEQTWK